MIIAFTICDYESKMATLICSKEEMASKEDWSGGDQRWPEVEVEVEMWWPEVEVGARGLGVRRRLRVFEDQVFARRRQRKKYILVFVLTFEEKKQHHF